MRATPLPAEEPALGSEGRERLIVGQWIPYSKDQAIPWGHVLYVADRLRLDVPTCLEHFSARGLNTSASPAERVGFDDELDLALVREVQGPAVDRLRTLNTNDVINAARAVGRSVADVRCRLSDLGLALPSTMTNAHFEDANLLRRFIERLTPVEPGETVSAAAVHIVASENFLTVKEVSDRLVAAGLTIQDTDYPKQRAAPEELLILRENGSALNNWIDLDEPVGLEHLLVTAHRLGTTVSGVADRLRSFGLDVPDTQDMVTRAWDRVPRR